MTEEIKAQVLVVGGGPGGYVAAIRAGQLGLSTVLVEGDRLGGTCLIRGCIPSKALIHAASRLHEMARHAETPALGISLPAPPVFQMAGAVAWKDGIVDKLNRGVAALLKKAKVQVIPGWATFADAKTCTVEGPDGGIRIRAENVILATGSEPVELPNLPFGGPILSSSEALALDHLPEKLAVVGAGYIGLELGIAFAKMGASVTVVEAEDRILPLYDRALTDPVRQWLERHGVALHLGARATGYDSGKLRVETAEGATDIDAHKLLVTVGRRPRVTGWGFENMGIDLSRGLIPVDAQCRTVMRGVFAIGDLVGEPMLAHKASAQGEMVAEIIAGANRVFDPAGIPAICFTEPEIVSLGLSPDEAAAQGIDFVTGIFPFAANGRALTMEGGADGGFVRVVARRDNHRILGIQGVGAHISELSGEFTAALEMAAVLEDVAGIIHAHPTLSEAFHEAALHGLGQAIHR